MLGNKQLLDPIDLQSMEKYYESQWGPETVWLLIFFKNVFFCVQQKKETDTGLGQHESK